jgi:hypothetical protein
VRKEDRMATIMIACNNKGCFSTDYHKLDTDTDQVVCSKCGNEIPNVSHYMKRTLKDFGQVFKRVRTSGELKCGFCGFTALPVIIEHDGGLSEAACVKCKMPDNHLTRYFIEALKLRNDIVKVKPGEVFDEKTTAKKTENLSVVDKALKNSSLSPKRSDRPVAANEENTSKKADESVTPKKDPPAPRKRQAKAKTVSDILSQAGYKALAEETKPSEEDVPEKKKSFKSVTRKSPKVVTTVDSLEII